MKFLIIFTSCLIGSGLCWGGYRINFEHRDLEFDENIMNVEIAMKRRDDRTVVNMRGELFEDINDPIYLHVSHFEKDSDGEYKHLVNASINACNMLSRTKAHPILKIILKELLRASNIPTACPVKKGLYYMKDFTINEDILPPFLPIGNFMSVVRVTRLIDDDEEMNLYQMKLFIDIDYAKERKATKFF
ncbi:hypothetical protein PVAND_015273 [Polypedilum vanderplanki]|uniref:Uncharacterized protein n=1 Tax=Polypedilum vanderplanki TaxID=319348 RepID=A0A9J6BCA5_POLVA|nr:hypothetical protein PVAND_015273 [Polypedilum vanderplanki]